MLHVKITAQTDAADRCFFPATLKICAQSPKNEEKSGVSALNPNFMDVSCHIVLQPKFTIHLTYI